LKILLTILFFLPLFAVCQKTGTWFIGDAKIVRPNDSTQIEYSGKNVDTMRVDWVDKHRYVLNGKLQVKITAVKDWGYIGVVTDGKNKKYFEAYILHLHK
jgi:hypothetical protein